MRADTRIAFIGGGNMGRSLIGGLLNAGIAAASLAVSDPAERQRRALADEFGIRTSEDNAAIVRDADVVVFAVKPQVFQQAARTTAPALPTPVPLVISIAAGIPVRAIQRWLGAPVPVVRAMPNTPALLGAGAAGLYATPEVSANQRRIAQEILEAVGVARWVEDESLVDVVTAVSGSGPAYFFLLMELVEKAGSDMGLDARTARALSVQTALGASRMAAETGEDPSVLRKRVTSPGGTTAAALDVLEEESVRAIFGRALTAACDRARELSRQFGEASDEQ